jgi:hypothetical protein
MRRQLGCEVSVFVCIFGWIYPGVSAAVPRAGGPRPPSFERTKVEKLDPFRKKSEKASLERLQRSKDEQQILSALGINLNEMNSLVREFKATDSEYSSFQNLLRSSLHSSSKEDRMLLQNYFRLLARASGQFHLSPSRLEHQLTGWAPLAKLHFARVLETATQYCGDGKSVLREEAFERALKKYDLERDYRKQCRK